METVISVRKDSNKYLLFFFFGIRFNVLGHFTMAVQARNRLCPKCKRELTDEEEAKKVQMCWICLAVYLKEIGEEATTPDPGTYGRVAGYKELETQLKTQSLQTMTNSSAPTQPQIDTPPISTEERTEIIRQFGVDPLAAAPVTTIVVKGRNDDTFLQFSTRGLISPEMRKEFERWMKVQLEVMGTVMTFGPNYASTILQMKMMSGMEFLKT
jgi:hypothetical protein